MHIDLVQPRDDEDGPIEHHIHMGIFKGPQMSGSKCILT